MKLDGSVVLVTGANRGIGLAFARAALARGARKVYAAAREPSSITLAGVHPLRLDVTSDDDVAEAARQCGDATIVVNNAGIAHPGGALATDATQSLRDQLEVNVFGTLRMARAFAPVLARNSGGALINVLSVASWINRPSLGMYGVSKTAAWGLTNALRHELRGQGTQVLAMHMGFVDTELTRAIEAEKSSPDTVVARALDALESGAQEVLADDLTTRVKRSLSAEPGIYLVAP
jgi:NAD(P)-dependent dehydrogenase (short-subunit alcohol dehydrogenase family)